MQNIQYVTDIAPLYLVAYLLKFHWQLWSGFILQSYKTFKYRKTEACNTFFYAWYQKPALCPFKLMA